MKKRICKNDLSVMMSKMSVGKRIEGKFYNKVGVTVVTFECQKEKDGTTSKTFRIGRHSPERFPFEDSDEAWQTLTEKHGLLPPKKLILIELPHRNITRQTRITNMKRCQNLTQTLPDNHKYIFDYPVNLGRQMAENENKQRVQDYIQRKVEFCNGIGLRRVKLFLNKQIKKGDNVAKMYRLALEIECVNLAAKEYLMKYHSDYYNYNRKEGLLRDLLDVCRDHGVNYGVQDSTVPAATHVIYFDLPECEQISFHTNLHEAESLPFYQGVWDGLKCSTLRKLETAILTKYKNEMCNS